jgi:uncharacterized protein
MNMIRAFPVLAVAMTTIAFMGASRAETSAQPDPLPAAQAQSAGPPLPPDLKRYWFVMLKKGPTRDQSEQVAQQLQAGHMANIQSYAEKGALQIAGPFMDDGDWRGIFILDVPDRAAAEAMCDSDPSVRAGRLACEIHPWMSQPGSTLK